MSCNAQQRESIIKIKLIGTLKIGDKINTRYLAVQPDTFATKISRYMYGENRSQTIIFCRNTVSQCQELIKTMTDENMKKIIISDLDQAKQGLIALQESYSSDVRVVSELSEILESI